MPLDLTAVLSSMSIGQKWSGGEITFSIPTAGSTWSGYGADSEPFNAHYATLTAAQADQFRQAIQAWDNIIEPDFREVSEPGAVGDIRVAVSSAADVLHASASGWTQYPNSSPAEKSGDVWIDYVYGPNYTLYLHELGHALGLKHPGDPGSTIPSEYQTYQYSDLAAAYPKIAMDYVLTGTSLQSTAAPVYAQGPGLFDIYVAQQLYGAETSYHASDSVYTFAETDLTKLTLYDPSGIDTIDLSKSARASSIDLTPGNFSSVNLYSLEDQIAHWRAAIPTRAADIAANLNQNAANLYTWSNNLSIAYGTVIENVLAGSGNDTVQGNDADNSISGGAGQDYLRGGLGNDQINGGAEFDDINGNQGNDTLHGDAGDDWVVGGKDNDALYGDAGNDIVYGNLGDDTISGGDGNDWVRGGQGNDSVSGGAGDDLIYGDRGDDTISGGAGADTFRFFSGAGLDRVIDFNYTEGDRVIIEGGTSYTVAQSGADTVVTLSGGGDTMVLVGVTPSNLPSGWIAAG